MNRKDLAQKLAREADLPVAAAESAVETVLKEIIAAVGNGDKVTLSGFGTFELRHRAPRRGRNPQTGEEIQIAASDTPAFKAAAAFKSATTNR